MDNAIDVNKHPALPEQRSVAVEHAQLMSTKVSVASSHMMGGAPQSGSASKRSLASLMACTGERSKFQHETRTSSSKAPQSASGAIAGTMQEGCAVLRDAAVLQLFHRWDQT